MSTSAPLALGPDLLRQIFPFFFSFDREMKLTQAGPAASKVCSNIADGAAFGALFEMPRRKALPSYEQFLREIKNAFFVDSKTTGVRLRGQIVHLADRDELLFLGSPWFTDVQQLEKTNLALSDFTVHDPIVDFLYMVQARSVALEDAKKFSDTVERQRDELLEANRELARASAAKSQFLANTSHELRTPLNAILGMAQLLERTELTPTQRHFGNIIQQSGASLLALVNDILDFARMDAEKLTLEHVDFDLQRLAFDAVEGCAHEAQRKGLEIACDVDRNVPSAVHGDPTRLRQILTNLLSNAVKFTSQGEVILRVERVEGASETFDGALVRLSVKDTGIGIDAEQQQQLFQPFEQVDSRMSRKFGGSGLGLVISRKLARLMDGDVTVESEKGKGSTFTASIRLPIVSTASRPAAASPPPRPNLRALVVDQSATLRAHASRWLEAWGVRCDVADSAEGATEKLRAAVAAGAPIDVAFIDLRIQGMSGVAVVVGSDPAYQGLRTVTLRRLDQLDAGPAVTSDSLSVPLRPERLCDCVSSLFRARDVVDVPRSDTKTTRGVGGGESGEGAAGHANGANGHAANGHGGANGDARAPKPVAFAEQFVLVVDDNAINREVAICMLETLGYRAEGASNGREALDACQSRRYAAVLMDLQMPELDGYGATVELRRKESGKSKPLPIIAMTAHAMDSDRKRALDVGMNDYIAKPIRIEGLQQLMQRWAPTAQTRAPEAKRQTAQNPSLDESALDDLRKTIQPGGPNVVLKVLRLAANELREVEQRIDNAWAKDGVAAVGRIVHALKSGTGMVGAARLSRCCADLEDACRNGDETKAKALHAQFREERERVARIVDDLLEREEHNERAGPSLAAPDRFLADLLDEMRSHRALRHPFLHRFGEAKLSMDQLAAHAAQHYLYSRFFGRNLAAVIANIPDEAARNALIVNLYEEIGEPLKIRDMVHLLLLNAGLITAGDIATAIEVVAKEKKHDTVGVLIERGVVSREQVRAIAEAESARARDLTHPALFRRYLSSVGLSPDQIGRVEPLPETAAFIDVYSRICREGHWLEAMGAMGPGTECAVPMLYTPIERGIQSSKLVHADDYIFWTIHIVVDDGHGAAFCNSVRPYVGNAQGQRLVASGCRKVLEARARWFDGLERLVFSSDVAAQNRSMQ